MTTPNIIDLNTQRNHVNMHYQISGVASILAYLLSDHKVLRITLDERATPQMLIEQPPVDSKLNIHATDVGTMRMTTVKNGDHTVHVIWHT